MKHIVKGASWAILVLAFFLGGCRSSILQDPSTVIQFSIPQPLHVMVTIVNSYNTTVATLIDSDLQAGNYAVNYNAGGLQEGVYFFTIECKGIGTDYYSKDTKYLLVIK